MKRGRPRRRPAFRCKAKGEAKAPLRNGGSAGNRFGDDSARPDLEASGFDFLNLVLGVSCS